MRDSFQPASFYNFQFSAFNLRFQRNATPPSPPLQRRGNARDRARDTCNPLPRYAGEPASRRSACYVIWVILAFAGAAAAQDAAPRSLDPRLKIELFAEHPQIVTPTGIDVDSKGRVWAIESNTHFPPEGYKGHPTDRILVMSDTGGDAKADRIVVFADGLKHTMSVAVRPPWLSSAPRSPKTSVYIATRREISLIHDDDGDDK